MYQRIMVPMDGSELAECVLPHVETIAKGCQVTEVVFVKVVENVKKAMSPLEIRITEEQINKYHLEAKARAEDYLKKLVARVNLDGVKVQWKVLDGYIADELVSYATESGVDFIIIATHGHSGIGRWYFGSVADRVVRSACVPVLAVRAPGCEPHL